MIRSKKRKPSILRPNARKNRNVDPQGLEYLRWLKTLPCLVCMAVPQAQTSPTEAAHINGNFAAKADNMSAVPLCAYHHRLGSFSQEVLKRRFFECHNLKNYDEVLGSLHADFGMWEEMQYR